MKPCKALYTVVTLGLLNRFTIGFALELQFRYHYHNLYLNKIVSTILVAKHMSNGDTWN